MYGKGAEAPVTKLAIFATTPFEIQECIQEHIFVRIPFHDPEDQIRNLNTGKIPIIY